MPKDDVVYHFAFSREEVGRLVMAVETVMRIEMANQGVPFAEQLQYVLEWNPLREQLLRALESKKA